MLIKSALTNLNINDPMYGDFTKKLSTSSASVSNNVVPHKRKHKKDIYTETPVRYFGYTNEVGAAMAPMLGPVGEMVTYGPVLAYIVMDIKDKYKRGDNDDYEKASRKRATKQLIFQALASITLPTAAVKAGQILAGSAIDRMPKVKQSIKEFVIKRPKLDNFIKRFADNPPKQSFLNKAAHSFQKVIDTITVVPLFIKSKPNKSGLRNAGLTLAGFAALFAAMKPIDMFVENVILKKAVDPILYKKNKQVDAK